MGNNLTYRQLSWLKSASIEAGSGMYDGTHWDAAPKTFAQLERMGLVRLFEPSNRAHVPRAIITEAGRKALDTDK